MRVEQIVLNEKRNVTLTVYLQEVGGEFRNVVKRPAMLVLPGGGYQMCSDREADPVAMPYLKAGYQVFILRYSVRADAVWPNPLEDYEQAMELIRSRAEEWNLYADKVAVIGFSAGGHLAAAAATMAKNRPNAAILGYAVTSEDVKGCNKTAPDTICEVDFDTCPCFLFATRTDNIVPIANSIRFMEALDQYGIAFESHIYSHGPHGFSTCDTSVQHKDTVISSRVPNWVADSISWLKDVFGDYGDGEMTKPVCPVHVNGDHEPFLSADCTFGRLMSNPQSKAILDVLMAQMQKAGSQAAETGMEMNEDMAAMVNKMTLRDMLAFVNTPVSIIEQLDEQLKQIPNV